VEHTYKQTNGLSYKPLQYSAFTDKVERNCHFPAPGRNCYNTGKLILLFFMKQHLYRENLVALGGESWSSRGGAVSVSCVELYQWTRCIFILVNKTCIFPRMSENKYVQPIMGQLGRVG
jgi:hypothetical protein